MTGRKLLVRLALASIVPLFVTACSSSTSAPSVGTFAPGAATLDNTIPTMPAHYSVSAAVLPAGAGTANIVVTSLRGTDACSTVQMSATSGVANVFQAIVSLDSTTIAPGMFTLGDGWHATYHLADDQCASAADGAATKGTLEIDSVDTSLHGIADMTFPSGRVIAQFNAPTCNASQPAGGGNECVQVPGCPEGSGTDLNPMPTETCNEIP